MADVFTGWAIVAWSEGVKGIANAVDIVEELAKLASPRFCAGEGVVGDETKAPRYVALEMQREGVVTGAIVGAEDGYVGKTVAAVAVHAGLEGVVRAQNPIGIEGVLNAGSGMQRVRSVVMRIDQRGRAGSILDVEIVDGVEGLDPAVLRKVVEIQTNAAAQNRVAGGAEAISDAEARREGFAVVVRDSGDNTVAGEGGIEALVVAGSDEEAKGSVVAQAVVDCQIPSEAPGILSVKSQALDVLREAAIATRSKRGEGTWGIRRLVCRIVGIAGHDGGKLALMIGQIEARILRRRVDILGGGGQGTAENRFVNKVEAKARRVSSADVTDVIAKLIFFLVAQNRKGGNRCEELIVAESLYAGDGAQG